MYGGHLEVSASTSNKEEPDFQSPLNMLRSKDLCLREVELGFFADLGSQFKIVHVCVQTPIAIQAVNFPSSATSGKSGSRRRSALPRRSRHTGRGACLARKANCTCTQMQHMQYIVRA